jgi:polysaccharide biosynthesis transport protein
MDKPVTRKFSAAAALAVLRRRALYLLIPAVILGAAAWTYARRMPQNFRARVQIGAEPVVPVHYLSDRPTIAPVINVQDQMRAIRDVLLSPALLRQVIDEVGPAGRTQSDLRQAVDDMKSKIRIQVDTADSFTVSLEGSRAAQTTESVNRLAEMFVDRTRSMLGERTQQVDSFLDAEVAQLKRQLDQQEQGVAGYKQSVSQALPDRVATNLKHVETLQQDIQSKTDHISEAEARRSAIQDELRAFERQGALTPEPATKTAQEIALEDARIKLRQLHARYTPQTPLVVQAEKEVKDLEAAVASQVKVQHPPSMNQMRYFSLQAELKSVDERIKGYTQQRDALTAELRQSEHQVETSPGFEGAIARLSRDAAITRSRYEALLNKQQEAKLDQRAGQAGNGIVYRVIEAAAPPSGPTGPKRYQIALLGLIAGLGLGLGLIFLLEQFDSSFGTVEDFQGFTNLPVMAAVPTIANRGPKPPGKGKGPRLVPVSSTPQREFELDQRHLMKHRLAVVSDPRSVPSEQYRILTLKVMQWMRQTSREDRAGKVLVVTSAAGGEGKSVTALNLSLALADSMRGKVLLVDGDLWRPRVSQYLGIEARRGVSELLTEDGTPIDSCVAHTANLDVIGGGSPLADPAGLLSSERAGQVLQQLRDRYRLIVLDGPPIVPTSDSHVLAGLADGVLLVVRARQTKRELLKRALESLNANNLLGVVLNDVNYRDTEYAYAYRYYQRECVGGR